MAGLTYHLKFEDISAGLPSINVFEAYHSSDLYLKNTKFANKQILRERFLTVDATERELDKAHILPGNAISPFLVEGKSAGLGALTLIVKRDGSEILRRKVALELRPIAEFYEKFMVASTGVGDFVNSTSSVEGVYTYQPESDDYIMYVHGWNMKEWEKDRWVETMFKRLWWQGYKGHCGLFSWPTLTTSMPAATPWNYDHSEMRSWHSAEALLHRLERLNSNSPGKVRILAHSMGNVVSTEALRQSPSQVVHTFISSQAAIPANIYDNDIVYKNGSSYWDGYTTPDVYGHYFSGGNSSAPYAENAASGAGKMIRMYNVDDYALWWWQYNNERKPDLFYNYSGNIDNYNPSSGSRFYHNPVLSSGERDLVFPDDRFEIFAFAAESRSFALGAEPKKNVSNYNLNIDLFKLVEYEDKHYHHSKQFRSNLIDEFKYWEAVINKSGLKTYK